MLWVRYAAWQKARGLQRFAVTSKRRDTLTIRPTNPESWDWRITEGYYLAIILPVGTTNGLLNRSTAALAQVQSVPRNLAVTLSLAPEVIKQVKKGQQLLILRPPGSTTHGMRRIPKTARVKHIDLFSKLSADKRQAVIMADRMRVIGKALYSYHDVHGHFPPAVVYGPDGKPWHSWRMLIMGYGKLDIKIPNRCRYDEPWNSKYNRQFIEECPEQFRFPDSKSGNTPFVVVTGKKTAFPAQGAKFDGNVNRQALIYGSAKSTNTLEDFVDGLSYTFLLGTVGRDLKILWTKP
jgi:hypothetical protein